MQKILTYSLLLTGITNPLSAQEIQTENTVDLPTMVVTATRTEEAKNTLAAGATVYTRADIERLQVNNLPELLRGSTGLDVTQNGGPGQISSVFMRGSNSDQVLVLVDGVRFGSATSGTSPFENIPMAQVERVEIIRGPQSGIYGPEAVGGVIQIFTRKGAQKAGNKPTIVLEAGGGSYHTHKESGNISGKFGNSWYNLGASNYDTQGFNARQKPPYGTLQPDHDGYENRAMNARVGHKFDNNAEVEAFITRAEGMNQFDADYGGDNAQFVKQVLGVSGAMNFTDNWHSSLRLGQSRDDYTTLFHDKSFDNSFNTTRWTQSWLNEIAIASGHKLIVGEDFFLDEVDGSTAYTKSSRYNVGGFVEYRGQFFDNHFITASQRIDGNETFGNYPSGTINWRSNWFDNKFSTFAGFGSAIKMPSFNNLYYPNYGNPNLKPEESTSVEAGFALNHKYAGLEIRAYHQNISNLITPVLVDPITYRYGASNVGKSQIDGIEAEFTTHYKGWNSKLSMNLISPVNRETNATLPRRARQTLSFDLSKSIGPVDFGAFVMAQGHRYDDPANTTKVDGYVTVDLRTAYHIDKNWLLSAKLNNLLDKQYQTVNTYNTADRNFFVSIQYNN